MADAPGEPPTPTDPAIKTSAGQGNSPTSPSKRFLSVLSSNGNGWNIAHITGKMPALKEELVLLDRNGDGRIDVDELAAAVEKLADNRSTIKNLRLTIAVLAAVVILIVGANFGLSFATASLSQKLKTGNGNALVDSSTGVTLRTASGRLSAPYTLLDAITTSDNMTTVRYSLPVAVAQAGCQLYTEGHFDVPASIFGPQAVYGNSTRPRTYTILEVVGCNSDGTLAQGAALEATLVAHTVEDVAYYIFFTCAPGAVNCTAAQFWDAQGNSVPSYSAINRRLLSASTSDLLASLAHGSRRSVLSMVVPGALPTGKSGKQSVASIALAPAVEVWAEAEVMTSELKESPDSSSRTAQHLRGMSRKALAESHVITHHLFFAMLPALSAQAYPYDVAGGALAPGADGGDSEQLVGASRGLQSATQVCSTSSANTPCAPKGNNPPSIYANRRSALEVYKQHLYASSEVAPHDLQFYDCVVCTFLWRNGYLADDVYWADFEFGVLMKEHVPWVHKGYLVYGRKLVSLFTWAGDWYTGNVMAPITQPWALLAGHMVGRTHHTFTTKVAIEGALCFSGIGPFTVMIGAAQLVLPVVLTDLLGYLMTAWILMGAVLYRVTSLMGQGWVGLLLPQVVLLRAVYRMWPTNKPKHMVSTSKRSHKNH